MLEQSKGKKLWHLPAAIEQRETAILEASSALLFYVHIHVFTYMFSKHVWKSYEGVLDRT